MPTQQTVNPIFVTNQLNEQGRQKRQHIAEAFNTLYNHLEEWCQNGREFNIVKQHLEDAGLYAVKSMASIPSNQQTPGQHERVA
jgi:hypothetical protein